MSVLFTELTQLIAQEDFITPVYYFCFTM